MTPRKIIHLDLDAFFCAVEELTNPKLRGKPFAVGGRPETRGVVASCSYAARQYGIRSAMPMSQAVKLCSSLQIVSSNYKNYTYYSNLVMEILHEITPRVEQVSIDEAFLDVSDQAESDLNIAIAIQARINTELRLPCSIGVATNKLLAKIANDIGKKSAKSTSPPNTITQVPPGQEAEFLAPLPVQALWGVGPKTSEEMASYGLVTVGDIAKTTETELIRLFGKNGLEFFKQSRGIDERPIYTEHKAKSISNETTFAKDVRNLEVIENTLSYLARKVANRLRKSNTCARTVSLKIRWSDFTTITRQITFQQPIWKEEILFQASLELFHKVWHKDQPVRLIGVGVSGLENGYIQLGLWDNNVSDLGLLDDKLLAALETLHKKYGDQIVRLGIDY